MEITIAIDGTPDEVKVSCPVWRGGKSGDYFKGLPITIRHHLRRLCAELADSGSPLQGDGKQDGAVRLRQSGQGRSQPEPADDGATSYAAG